MSTPARKSLSRELTDLTAWLDQAVSARARDGGKTFPDPEAFRAALRELALLDDVRALAWLVANRAQPHVVDALGDSVHAAGADTVLALVRANPALDGKAKYENADQFELRNLIGYLARHRIEASWDIARELFEHHPLSNVVSDARWALVTWGDARSIEVLERAIMSPDHQRQGAALQAMLKRGAGQVIDRLGGMDALTRTGAAGLVSQLLHQVAADSQQVVRGVASLGWLTSDQRYVDLALAWVKDKRVKGSAQYVLDQAGNEVVAAERVRAGAASKPVPKPRVSRTKLPDGDALLARFQGGERAAVLAELTKLGKRVRDPALLPAAERIAHLTMLDVRAMLERMIAVLDGRGYQFVRRADALGAPARPDQVAALEQAVGPLPIVLREAFLVLGTVDLRGSHPDFARPACLALPGVTEGKGGVWLTDPLVLGSVADILDDAREHEGDDAAFSLPIAPDELGKAGYSAGALTMEVPDEGFDAPVDGSKAAGLLPLLRGSLAQGGLPGLARVRSGPRGFGKAWLAELCAIYRPF